MLFTEDGTYPVGLLAYDKRHRENCYIISLLFPCLERLSHDYDIVCDKVVEESIRPYSTEDSADSGFESKFGSFLSSIEASSLSLDCMDDTQAAALTADDDTKPIFT